MYTIFFDYFFPPVINPATSKLYVLNESSLDQTYSEDKIRLMEIEIQLEKMEFKRIVIMSKKINQEYLEKELAKYSKQKISYLIDESLDNNIIKILLEN